MPRPPNGERAMTDYERTKRHREAVRAKLARLAKLEAENARLREALDVATEALAVLRRSRALQSSV